MTFIGESGITKERDELRRIVANLAAFLPWREAEQGGGQECFFCGVMPYDSETHADRGCLWQAARDATEKMR